MVGQAVPVSLRVVLCAVYRIAFVGGCVAVVPRGRSPFACLFACVFFGGMGCSELVSFDALCFSFWRFRLRPGVAGRGFVASHLLFIQSRGVRSPVGVFLCFPCFDFSPMFISGFLVALCGLWRGFSYWLWFAVACAHGFSGVCLFFFLVGCICCVSVICRPGFFAGCLSGFFVWVLFFSCLPHRRPFLVCFDGCCLLFCSVLSARCLFQVLFLLVWLSWWLEGFFLFLGRSVLGVLVLSFTVVEVGIFCFFVWVVFIWVFLSVGLAPFCPPSNQKQPALNSLELQRRNPKS